MTGTMQGQISALERRLRLRSAHHRWLGHGRGHAAELAELIGRIEWVPGLPGARAMISVVVAMMEHHPR